MDTLFSNVTIVTMNPRMEVLFSAYLGVQDGKISHLSHQPPEEKPQTIIDGTGMVLLPGLINCHTHLPMSLFRGSAEDCSLGAWLQDHIFPREDRLDARAVRAGTLLSLAECIRFGVTSVSDMYGYTGQVAQAVAESGLKANLSLGQTLFLDETEDFSFESDPGCQALQQVYEKWHGYDGGRIQIDASLHAEYTSNYRLWEALHAFAAGHGLRMQLHLSETQAEHQSCKEKYGLTPAQLLDCHHVFDTPATAAHCVHLEPEDMRLLARRGATAVHCPISNLKLASGVAPVTELVKAGMNVALGTDSAASNNNLDLFEEMKAAALAAKARTGDPGALPAQAVLMMATVCGARAQGREKACGMIQVGLDADLILVDFTAPHLMPCHDVFSSLVYAAGGSDVALTMVRGKILYAGGKFTTIDLDAVVQELAAYAIPRAFSQAPDSAVQSADSQR